MHTADCLALRADHLCVDLDGRRILDSISLVVQAGEFLGLIGPNGGGKTTLLRALLGLLPLASGRVRWGEGYSRGQVRIGYVPQKVGLYPHYPLSLWEAVMQGRPGRLPLLGEARRQARHQAWELLGQVGLAGREQTAFVHLSGGEQRRALLARALMQRPNALVLDEPTAGVDLAGQEQFCGILRRYSREGLAILLVSHDIPLVMRYADRIACLATTLHWHGQAGDLTRETIYHAFQCELERYLGTDLPIHRHGMARCCREEAP